MKTRGGRLKSKCWIVVVGDVLFIITLFFNEVLLKLIVSIFLYVQSIYVRTCAHSQLYLYVRATWRYCIVLYEPRKTSTERHSAAEPSQDEQ